MCLLHLRNLDSSSSSKADEYLNGTNRIQPIRKVTGCSERKKDGKIISRDAAIPFLVGASPFYAAQIAKRSMKIPLSLVKVWSRVPAYQGGTDYFNSIQ